jgi:Family of unknown function (DUF5993)
MEFSLVFLVYAASLWVAWKREARKAILLFMAGLGLTVALYLHHATDPLPLSF